MEIYIKTIFWINVLALTINILKLSWAEFPEKREVSMGTHIAAIMICAGLTIWGGFLVFG